MPKSVFSHITHSQQLEKTNCLDTTFQSHNECCKDHKKQEDDTNDCNGICGSFACHCPSTTTLPINYLVTSVVTTPAVVIAFQNLCNYTKQQPKPVYFQIWSPPKLS